ncbi:MULTISPECIES: DUF397 domain-containing protein [unclassified Streptomyces]|uniref:DUF397 domain-containing protein n=1 Tax=unclassified Streptomyces TaxID=2593676 RepID=UPI000BF89ADA|nr:DUF397 domain-containing protein [Streptomyces sp. Ru87]PGH47102.1 DUF397 domain-containing protein [Streptomyces sp. Ru87]
MSIRRHRIPAHVSWQKSSYSNGAGGECVETACMGSLALVRDSKDHDRQVLAFSRGGWADFVTAVRGGTLRRPSRA